MASIQGVLLLFLTAVISACASIVFDPPAEAAYQPGEGSPTIHVVGLYEAGSRQHFRLIASWGEDTDWSRLCNVLVEQGKNDDPSPGQRIWALLSAEARGVATDKELVSRINAFAQNLRKPPRDLEAMHAFNKIRGGMEEVLRKPDFYVEKSFAGVTLDDETKELVKRQKKLLPLEACLLNRRLLEASFPDAIQKTPFSLAKATVPVRVVATKEPITLVLCSYESVRWEIKADKGAKIEKVIVGGYHMQAVTGTDARVTYRVYEGAAGAQAAPHYIFAYKQDQEYYPKLVQALRKLTGTEVSTFQGRYSYEGGPAFVVGSKE